MLIQFSFKNFKSFKDEAILDLSATKITEFSDRVVSIGREKLLPVAAIYGANASGKSNVYNAFEYMSDYVAESFKYGDDEENFESLDQPRFCLILCQQMQSLASRFILLCRKIRRERYITMAFALIRKALRKNG